MNKKPDYFLGNVNDFQTNGGWFLGYFMDKNKYPVLSVDKFEVGYKITKKVRNKHAILDPLHVHHKSVEVVMLLKGWVLYEINGHRYKMNEGEFYYLYPDTPLCVKDASVYVEVAVVKTPSVPNDKILIKNHLVSSTVSKSPMYKIEDFGKSDRWFIGRFMDKFGYPRLVNTDLEIAWKNLDTSYFAHKHYHKVGTEVNIVVNGSYVVEMNGKRLHLNKHDFLVVQPGVIEVGIASEDNTVVLCIKSPSEAGDKYAV